ncbi:MAG: hypothetical protein F9K40_09510 [Kofleriaceae bacterium]|nr:MAG: hypothetical protein F9K40_09510 [Kofleriaceae bacterium]MBZ0232705.1 hypothetical protein [Kofleriaceae bacterium]
MRAPQICSFVLITVAATVGCGGGSGDGDDDGTDIDASNGGVDAAIPADYTRLIGREWSLPPAATDTYRCVRLTLQSDTYVTNIMAQAPVGTHHTVLSIASSNVAGPDGEYNCSVNSLGRVMLYASGVGTSPLDFPDGVGIRIPAGTQIHLNLHLYNASDNPISGDTAILVKQPSTPPPMLAEMAFSGRFLGWSIPNNGEPVTTSGGCTAESDFTLFAVWPHQHQLGTHHKFEIIPNGGQAVTLHDAAYNFTEQSYYLTQPMHQVRQGDTIRTTCTWVNNTDISNVGFGESSDEEMCFTGMYRFPAQNTNLFRCTDTQGIGF